MRPSALLTAAAALSATVALAACGTPIKSASTSGSSAASCAPDHLPLHQGGFLTVATDSPAYPPYFENNHPPNRKGLESAVAYAVAHQMGFPAAKVKWVVEPFDSSYAPGPKAFDFDINEISITPKRAKAVSFSIPYYTNPQGIIVASNSPLAHATSLSDFKNAKIGVQIGTTSLSAVNQLIKPTQQPYIFNTSSDVVSAFKIHRVNAVVTDLATAFTLTSTSLPHTTVAGQFSAPGGDNWGLLLAKGSGLTRCVDKALTTLRSNGTLTALDHRWIASAANVPVLH